jgi:hypothetical protein
MGIKYVLLFTRRVLEGRRADGLDSAEWIEIGVL